MKKNIWKEAMIKGLPMFSALACAILLVFFIWNFDTLRTTVNNILSVFTPVIIGGAIAYILKTPTNFFEKTYQKIFPKKLKKISNGAAVFTSLLIALLAIYLFLAMVIPELIDSLMSLVKIVPDKMNDFLDWFDSFKNTDDQFSEVFNQVVTSIELKAIDWVNMDLIPTMQGMSGQFATTVGNVVTGVLNVVLGFFLCIYLLSGRKVFARQAKGVVYVAFKKERADNILREAAFVDKTFTGFFGGKILEAIVMGFITYVFCFIMSLTMGFKNAVLISIIIGVTNIIPYFGAFLGVIPCALLTLIYSPLNCLIFVIFFAILQQVDGNVIGPRLLANGVGLDGFWVLFAIVVFGGFFGIGGMVFGVPVFAVLYDLFRRWLRSRLKAKGIHSDGTPREENEDDIENYIDRE